MRKRIKKKQDYKRMEGRNKKVIASQGKPEVRKQIMRRTKMKRKR